MAEIYRSAIRLLFEFEGTDVRLVRRQWLAMVAPASDPFPEDVAKAEPRAGAWIDLLDEQGRIVYRRAFGESPIAAHVSVYTGGEKQPFENLKTAPRGDFMVVVADIPSAETVAFFAPDPEVEGHGEAKEIARFALKEREPQDDDPRKGDPR
jgi:hypothetical protein